MSDDKKCAYCGMELRPYTNGLVAYTHFFPYQCGDLSHEDHERCLERRLETAEARIASLEAELAAIRKQAEADAAYDAGFVSPRRERLRSLLPDATIGDHLFSAAADEIERLRAKLADSDAIDGWAGLMVPRRVLDELANAYWMKLWTGAERLADLAGRPMTEEQLWEFVTGDPFWVTACRTLEAGAKAGETTSLTVMKGIERLRAAAAALAKIGGGK